MAEGLDPSILDAYWWRHITYLGQDSLDDALAELRRASKVPYDRKNYSMLMRMRKVNQTCTHRRFFQSQDSHAHTYLAQLIERMKGRPQPASVPEKKLGNLLREQTWAGSLYCLGLCSYARICWFCAIAVAIPCISQFEIDSMKDGHAFLT